MRRIGKLAGDLFDMHGRGNAGDLLRPCRGMALTSAKSFAALTSSADPDRSYWESGLADADHRAVFATGQRQLLGPVAG